MHFSIRVSLQRTFYRVRQDLLITVAPSSVVQDAVNSQLRAGHQAVDRLRCYGKREGRSLGVRLPHQQVVPQQLFQCRSRAVQDARLRCEIVRKSCHFIRKRSEIAAWSPGSSKKSYKASQENAPEPGGANKKAAVNGDRVP